MVPAPPPHELASVWERVREDLRGQLPVATFQLWIEPLEPVSAQGSTLHLAAPQTTRTWVERRYLAALEAALRATESGLQRVVVLAEGRGPIQPATTERSEPAGAESLPLDPGHTFERFVIGPGNRLAHSAALAVAEMPGEAYNPLFLHGPPGLGKTHLLGAIADYLNRLRPELTVHYTTADRFTAEFVGGLRKDGPERFKRRYRELDALLIDDVQALEGKERTQEEFVHTFNALHAAGKQIVLSSDRPPEAIARVAERLRDRFGWGLCAELACPDLRTRTALLWRMTVEGPVELGDPATLKEIAGRVLGNVRRLQGAMTRVAAFSSMLSEPVTPSLARRALAAVPAEESRLSTAEVDAADSARVREIQEAICSVCGVSREDLLSAKRTSRISHARQLAMYLAREETSISLAQIAREFNRDHTTVLHAIRTVTARLEPGSDTVVRLHRTRELITLNPRSRAANAQAIHQQPASPPSPSPHPPGDPLP